MCQREKRVRSNNDNKRVIYIAPTEAWKERALSPWDKNETWTTYEGRKDEQ